MATRAIHSICEYSSLAYQSHFPGQFFFLRCAMKWIRMMTFGKWVKIWQMKLKDFSMIGAMDKFQAKFLLLVTHLEEL